MYDWEKRWLAVLVLSICSASLSILGSGVLIFKILRDRANNGRTTPYNRMILGLAACDIISSITWAIDDFLYPSEYSVLTFGNAATCQAVGFFNQLSLSALWYNGLLSWFFLLTILSKIFQKNYVQQVEPWLHLTALYWPITATAGVFLGWFGEEGEEGVCDFVDFRMGLIFVGIPLGLVIVSIIINYGAIFVLVRKSLQSPEHVAGSESVPKRIEKETRTLMILYVSCFLISVTPRAVLATLGDSLGYSRLDIKLFPLTVFSSIFLPLQGFFNFFIYIKPVYARFRKAYPNKSRRFVLQQAILKSKAPPLLHRRVANHITQTSDVLITDVKLLPDSEIDPNEALFYPGVPTLPSSRNDLSDQPETNNTNEEG